ncbi:MAG: hypothetical protein IGS49_30140 [Chlorogloeopsis fritschii C42_A2020_084]|nr:hypothetical protein [Chlorogloeopsis fritschii C42_A2020_084]
MFIFSSLLDSALADSGSYDRTHTCNQNQKARVLSPLDRLHEHTHSAIARTTVEKH